MKTIFENALQVIIYLGQPTNNSDRLFEYLDKDSPGLLPSISNVLELFSRRWFHRVWVLQEVIAARRAIICCGRATYKWRNFADYKDFFYRLRTSKMPIDLPFVFRFGSVSNDRENWQLTSLLHATRHCSATDPRDKVFALFNLIKDSSQRPFKVDYSMSVQTVFRRVATRSILEEGSLSILSYVTGKSRLPNIPSWVPDWTITSTTIVLPPLSGSSPHLIPKDLNHLSPAVIWLGTQAETLEPTPRVSGLRLGSLWVEFQPLKPKGELGKWQTARDSLKCPLKGYFWEEFSRRLQRSPCHDGGWPSAIESSGFIGEVPPAFGGHDLCYTCQNLDRLYWDPYTNWGYPFWTNPHKRCICATFRRGKQSKHFFAEELDEFFDKMQRYGIHRRPFTTGYSLGFGPVDIQTGDSVWLLNGAEVPMVLRPVEDHYILIGSCYLHAIGREFDVCGICRTSNSRYQPAAVPPIPQTVTHRPSRSVSRALSLRYAKMLRQKTKLSTKPIDDNIKTLQSHWLMPSSLPLEWEVVAIR
ncbi:MAG: hypothetical protein M1813_009791 [Trichoglossum hirsutum]|nr:MAG: hypothetical protein M1813_009791 [Trichoglossum hirsutum]